MTSFKPIMFALLAACAGIIISFTIKTDSPDTGKIPVLSDRPVCGTVEHMDMMVQNYKEYNKNLDEIQKYIDEYIKKHGLTGDNLVVTIPVVVHVVWYQGSPQQNILYQQVLSQIRVLNEDFRRRNRDTVNTPVPFRPVAGDVQVEFCLARRDPSDNPTLGVTRTMTNVTEFNTNNNVKFNAAGGHDAWDRNKYLNIWVCNLGGSLLGYAEYPGGPAATDGVVIHYRYFGTIGTSTPPYNLGRTATHEIGHWLALRHIWGDDNGACWGTDYVDDTPNQASEFYGCPAFPQLDACTSTAPGVMFMNYMDYTDDGCMNIFTQGQSTRMNGILNGVRLPILSSNGCSNVSGVPIAMFGSDSTTIEYNNQVHFTDESAGIPTSWLWSFPGGSPSSSNVQNPAITYNTPGYYDVSLRVSNSHGSDSVTVVNYIRVRGAGMNSFSLISPPTMTRLQVSAGDPTPEIFKWQRSSSNPTIFYKFKLKKIATSTEYSYLSNNSGSDTVISLRRSFLDSLAATMGTTGDSVRCTWRVYANNGIDSLQCITAFLVTLVRNPIGIKQISSSVPEKYELFNNYPNPFNPVTKIKFQLPEITNVKLTIFDITGREISVIINEKLAPGTYEIDWDAGNYASGVYFYRFETASFNDTKRMIIVK